MFKNLIEVNVLFCEYGINRVIIIDNNKKDVSLDGEFNNLTRDEFNCFISFF